MMKPAACLSMAAFSAFAAVAGESATAVLPPPRYAPAGELGACEYLGCRGGRFGVDGFVELSKGESAVFAVQTPPTAHGRRLEWKSSGRIVLRAIAIGGEEGMQLSDTVVLDDGDAAAFTETKERSADIEQFLERFPQDLGVRFPHPTISGLHFFEFFPAGEEPVKVGDVRFLGARIEPQPALDGATMTLDPDGLPATLSPDAPSAEIAIGGMAGAFEIEHAAGRQPSNPDPTLAEWLVVYEDGTTEAAFATLRWNCGVARAEWLERGAFPDYTWWGPPGFSWGKAIYEPLDALGSSWSARYRWTLVNPHPERRVRALQVSQMAGDKREYTVHSVRAVAPKDTVIGLVEPESAAFETGRPLVVRAFEYRAAPSAECGDAEEPLIMEKSPGADMVLGGVKMVRRDRLGAGAATVVPLAEELGFGPVTLVCDAARSSRCSLMPPDEPGRRPFYYSMIGGLGFSAADFDRQRRLGYDMAKIHVGWKLGPGFEPDFSDFIRNRDKIVRAGLKIGVRNLFSVPGEYIREIPKMKAVSTDGFEEQFRNGEDSANPVYAERLVEYYGKFASLVARDPDVVSINANYGCRSAVLQNGDGKRGPRLVWSESRDKAFNGRRRAGGREAVSPSVILADAALLSDYSRFMERENDRLARRVCEAVRGAGFGGNLVFNVNFHPVEEKMSGQSFGEYLRIGRDLGPASLFHETSERYCLSFAKWLAAARTFGQPYGDECCQPPPCEEHAALAFMWMGMMQCFEANYCQWWGGRTTPQNVARFKAFHRLAFDAEYLPDPVCLAMSLATGHDEIAETARHSLHTVSMAHYGLANFLRELDINADRCMIDEFPELDGNVTSRLLIDDIMRAMPEDFADRIERFIRGGGTYLASAETDKLNDRAFLKRFGIGGLAELEAKAKGTRVRYAEVEAGAGRLVVLLSPWENGWELGRGKGEHAEMLALLTRLGEFEPLVSCSVANVCATPYRAKDGTILVSAINTSCIGREPEIGVGKTLCQARPVVRDLGSGRILDVVDAGGRWMCRTAVPKLDMTMLEIRSGP